MEKQSGFYKHENGEWMYASTKIIFPDGMEILVEKHDEYTYPIHGWVYYEYPPQEYLDSLTPPPTSSDIYNT
jgi:hypothetical protein